MSDMQEQMKNGRLRMEVQDLPLGIWKTICSFLNNEEKRNARLVSRSLRDAADESVVTAKLSDRLGNLPQLLAQMSSRLRWINNFELRAFAVYTMELQYLCQYKQLSCLSIDLEGLMLSDDAVRQLSYVLRLRSLRVSGATFESQQGLHSLSVLKHLSDLTLHNCKPQTIDIMSAIGSLQGLTSLEILRPYCFQDLGYSALASLSRLKALSLGYSWMLGTRRESLDFLYSLPNLTELSLRRCFASDESLQSLSALENLEHLSLIYLHRLEGHGLASIQNLAKLRSLNLSGCCLLKDPCLLQLNRLQNLTRLDLGSSKLLTTGAVAALLRKLPHLQDLTLPANLKAKLSKSGPTLTAVPSSDALPKRLVGVLEENLREMLEGSRGQPSDLSDEQANSILQWFNNQASS